MALINCPECNKEISDKAPACPHCGFPIKDLSEKEKTINESACNSSTPKEDYREIIMTSYNVDSAIDLACNQLGVPREIVEWEIMELPRKQFGIQTVPAKVRVSVGENKIEQYKQSENQNTTKASSISSIPFSVACPKCGSTQIQMVQRKWSMLTGFMTNKIDRVCVNCKNKF